VVKMGQRLVMNREIFNAISTRVLNFKQQIDIYQLIVLCIISSKGGCVPDQQASTRLILRQYRNHTD
jgi:hypothetical protein